MKSSHSSKPETFAPHIPQTFANQFAESNGLLTQDTVVDTHARVQPNSPADRVLVASEESVDSD